MKLRSYTLRPWPKGRYRRYRAQNACQRNAWMLAADHPDDLRLVKGYALMEDFQLWAGHWWCVDRDNLVVDPTWKNGGRAYIGIEEVDVAEYAKRNLAAGAYELEVAMVAHGDLADALEDARTVPTPVPTSQPENGD